jgi:UDP-glucose 4-epimerase
MRVLITGAGGTLGQALWPLLADRGDEVVCLDVADLAPIVGQLPSNVRAVRGDVRQMADVTAAMEGVDVVVHTAAIHGIHLATHPPRDFYELNVTGTFNVWQAAVAAKVKAMVFSSTMGVYGDSRRSTSENAAAIREDLPLLPTEIYGWSKVVGEEMCRLHWRADRIPSVALRYGMFVPEPFFRYGIRLLYGGVHEIDVADAVVASIDGLTAGRIEHEAFNVHSLLPFDAADRPSLRTDPLAALERHYPGSRRLLEQRGVTDLKPISDWFEMSRIDERLGFRPRHNFAEWLVELEHRVDERAAKNPPWP